MTKKISLEEALVALSDLKAPENIVFAVQNAYLHTHLNDKEFTHAEEKRLTKIYVCEVVDWLETQHSLLHREKEKIAKRTELFIKACKTTAEMLKEAEALFNGGVLIKKSVARQIAWKYYVAGMNEAESIFSDPQSETKALSQRINAVGVINESLRYLMNCAKYEITTDKDGNARLDKDGNIVSFESPGHTVYVDKEGNVRVDKHGNIIPTS